MKKWNTTTSLVKNHIFSTLLACTLAVGTATMPTPTQAYDPSDFASDAVLSAVQSIKDSAGNPEDTLKAFENVAEMITEGKGVGGAVNYEGVKMERGFVADEDTSIYNPGLYLMSASEKERLVEAVVDSRHVALEKGNWNEENAIGYDFLKQYLDPFHLVELKGLLPYLPVYAGVLYAVVFAVQRTNRDLFAPAVFGGIALFFVPIVLRILAGA
eukprot:CAMPEP_0116837340 /NCGR_PEP_ID=MMETSP0418-20121206/8598_1 /TAXON_ID=1158023 /ORGANISM="Astrosyne radiata, Strain 13vi08-1A" /LENGTH=213 /DNA_ID=CAMNT_0004467211 /DNA_START=131 /DNA_END=772 /DNA_ORIENTATION=-